VSSAAGHVCHEQVDGNLVTLLTVRPIRQYNERPAIDSMLDTTLIAIEQWCGHLEKWNYYYYYTIGYLKRT
jgi:hypothetical protein